MTFTVEELKKRYRTLTDKELLEELKWRNESLRWDNSKMSAEGTCIIGNIKAALKELIQERGLA